MSTSFKNLFTKPPIHNEKYVTNGHFLIEKSELKKNQLECVNSFPTTNTLNNQIDQLVKTEMYKTTTIEFKPERIFQDEEYNLLISENIGINKNYYNLVHSLKCRLFNVESDHKNNPLSIYNTNNEFVGVVLPVKMNRVNIEQSIEYNQYLEEQKIKQVEEKQRKQNLKKCLYIKDNKAVVKNKELILVPEFSNLYYITNKPITENNSSEVYVDFGIVYYFIGNYNLSQLQRVKDKIEAYTLEFCLQEIRESKNKCMFVNVAQIKLIELSGASQEEVQGLIDYREDWYNAKALEEQERREQREQEDRQYIAEQNKKVEDLILQVEQAILNKQEVKNVDVQIYKSRYNSNTLSLILYTMKQNNINVPLKTQGWINKALTKIEYNQEWNDYSYRYYKSSANSNVFPKYLNQLIKVIKEKHMSKVTV